LSVVMGTAGNNISYIGFMQVIRADMTCLGFIFPELKARGNI